MKKVLNEVSENYHKGIKSQILAFLSDSEARSTVFRFFRRGAYARNTSLCYACQCPLSFVNIGGYE